MLRGGGEVDSTGGQTPERLHKHVLPCLPPQYSDNGDRRGHSALNELQPLPPVGSRRDGPVCGRWDAILSLGSSCAIAYHLHRKGLATRTGPLDWFGSRDAHHVAHLLRTRFDGFMARRSLSVLGEHNGYWKVGDEDHRLFTLHDFPMVGRRPRPLWRPSLMERARRLGDRLVEPVWSWLPMLHFPGPGDATTPLPAFPEFRRRNRRRVRRFLAAALSPGPVLFIRRVRQEEEAALIHSGLRDLRGDLPTTLLVLGSGEQYAEDWGVTGLRTAVLPAVDPTATEGWRGRDEDWDRLFAGCRVGVTS